MSTQWQFLLVTKGFASLVNKQWVTVFVQEVGAIQSTVNLPETKSMNSYLKIYPSKRKISKLLPQKDILKIALSKKTFIFHYNLLRKNFFYQSFLHQNVPHQRHFHVVNNILRHLVFFNNIFTLSWKCLRIIVFISSRDRTK